MYPILTGAQLAKVRKAYMEVEKTCGEAQKAYDEARKVYNEARAVAWKAFDEACDASQKKVK